VNTESDISCEFADTSKALSCYDLNYDRGGVAIAYMNGITTPEACQASGQCYKTFYVRNLRIFVISWSVCPWQGFPA